MHIRLFEMTYRRGDIKAAIDDHLSQLIQNWCLCEAALISQDPKYLHWYHHWADELCAQIDPGIEKMWARGLSLKARTRLVDEVLFSDAHVDNPRLVYNRVSRKLIYKEKMPQDLCEKAVAAWINRGISEIRDVYINAESTDAYHAVLDKKDPEEV